MHRSAAAKESPMHARRANANFDAIAVLALIDADATGTDGVARRSHVHVDLVLIRRRDRDGAIIRLHVEIGAAVDRVRLRPIVSVGSWRSRREHGSTE